jgi:PAS domain S-box-containing protein
MSRQLRVLILEDKPRDAKLMALELENAGFDVSWKQVDSEKGYLDELSPGLDVILADGSVPDFDATRALDILKERGLDTPLIVVTGSLADERAVELIKRGAVDYLLKDRLARLGQAVGRALEQKKLAADARQMAEERDRFFSLSLDMMCVAGFDGYFKLLNPAWETVLGWSVEELASRPYLDFVHPEDRVPTRSEAEKAFRGEAIQSFENRYQRKDGSYRWLAWRAIPDVARRVLYATARDVTERNRAEKRFRDVLESAPDGMVIVNDKGEIVLINTQAERLFGYRRAELLGQAFEMLVPERFRQKHVGLRTNFLEGMRAQRMSAGLELYGKRKDGSEFPAEISLSPLDTEDGTLIVSAIRDITESKLMESQLRQSQKMEAIGKLAGGVAHDFNNLLTIINGYGELALIDLPGDHPAREMVREMVTAGDRAAGLTRQLLAFSRREVIAPTVLDVADVIGGMEKWLRRLIGEDMTLNVDIVHPLWAVKLDPGQLEQVVLNLVVNSRDAMPRGGALGVRVRNADVSGAAGLNVPQGRYVLVTVTDTGAGMDEATRARLFEPFFTTKGERGTGLGLATVYGIVKQTGGHIQVESAPGQGTEIRVYFPATNERPSGKSIHGPLALPFGSETVLVVEDEDPLRLLCRHVLAGCGYAVLEAANGRDALDIGTRTAGPIHLLVTDVVMPEMGGRELADSFLVMHPTARVLFVSGYTDDAILRHGVRYAEVAFLQKPFTTSALARKVREVLDEPRQ